MPPKAVTGSNPGILTEREQQLWMFACQCFEQEPKLDMNKFSSLAGFTNKGSAMNAWRNIRNKMGFVVKKESSETASPGEKRRTKAENEDDGSPPKKSRGGRKAAKSKVTTQKEDFPESSVDSADDIPGLGAEDVEDNEQTIVKREAFDFL